MSYSTDIFLLCPRKRSISQGLIKGGFRRKSYA